MTITSTESVVSWGAVIAGAVGAAALSLILFVLGGGLGLAAVSPWGREGISGTTAGVSSIIWITVVQLMASALGGYLAGRLRTRWVTVHNHEVYFRDTAHGFLAWAVSTLLMATLLSSAVTGVLSTGAKAGGMAVGSASDSINYSVDSLFRGGTSNNKAPEVSRILTHALQSGDLERSDVQYLGQVVASNTGISRAEAEQRVNETFNQLKESLDQARKASAWVALWLVVSLFLGAFVASFSATFGGRLRDSAVLANY